MENPIKMVKIMENPIKMDDLGGFNPLFSETSMKLRDIDFLEPCI